MKTIFLSLCGLAAFLVLPGLVGAQKTRTEVQQPTNPADDAKPNSDKVPAVYAAEGQFDRILVLRFRYETDLLAGLEKMVHDKNIRNGVILSGIGSVKSYHV